MKVAISRYLGALIALLLSCGPSSPRGSSYHVEDRYNPQHIDNLPADVRNALLRRCDMPKALHSFASQGDGSKRIVLHFEHFVCGGGGDRSYCAANGCLHQVWVSAGDRYRLSRSYYAPAGE